MNRATREVYQLLNPVSVWQFKHVANDHLDPENGVGSCFNLESLRLPESISTEHALLMMFKKIEWEVAENITAAFGNRIFRSLATCIARPGLVPTRLVHSSLMTPRIDRKGHDRVWMIVDLERLAEYIPVHARDHITREFLEQLVYACSEQEARVRLSFYNYRISAAFPDFNLNHKAHTKIKGTNFLKPFLLNAIKYIK